MNWSDVAVGFMGGLVSGAFGIWLTERIRFRLALRREARSRCGWCGRVRPHAPGQACEMCLAQLRSQANGVGEREGFAAGAAAPQGWPEA